MKRALATLVLGVSASACGGGASPTVPSVTPVPAHTASSVAALAVTSFDVTLGEYSSGTYFYNPSMVLAETSGKSAATIQSISFSILNGDTFSLANDSPSGQGCFLTSQSKMVPSGQTWNLNSVYAYCLDIDSRQDITGVPVTVTVSFMDEDGRLGAVTGTATAKK